MQVASVAIYATTPNTQHNKALHPTAYSLRSFARASLRRSGFRRRVSLIVGPMRAAWLEA